MELEADGAGLSRHLSARGLGRGGPSGARGARGGIRRISDLEPGGPPPSQHRRGRGCPPQAPWGRAPAA
eukprot:334628-Pyramimonas_sp.AAC.1